MNNSTRLTRLACLGLFLVLFSCKRPPLPPPIVVFDQAHGQEAIDGSKSKQSLNHLQKLFAEQGFIVKINNASLTESALNNVDALVIEGPQSPLSEPELQLIGKYLNNGGQLFLTVNQPAAITPLLSRLRVFIAKGQVREKENLLSSQTPLNFSLKNFPVHPLTKGLTNFDIYGGWPLNTNLEANIIAKTSPNAWVDLNDNDSFDELDASQAFPIIVTGQVGHGHFVVIGDDSGLQDENILGGNELFGKNLARWFKDGSYY